MKKSKILLTSMASIIASQSVAVMMTNSYAEDTIQKNNQSIGISNNDYATIGRFNVKDAGVYRPASLQVISSEDSMYAYYPYHLDTPALYLNSLGIYSNRLSVTYLSMDLLGENQEYNNIKKGIEEGILNISEYSSQGDTSGKSAKEASLELLNSAYDSGNRHVYADLSYGEDSKKVFNISKSDDLTKFDGSKIKLKFDPSNFFKFYKGMMWSSENDSTREHNLFRIGSQIAIKLHFDDAYDISSIGKTDIKKAIKINNNSIGNNTLFKTPFSYAIIDSKNNEITVLLELNSKVATTTGLEEDNNYDKNKNYSYTRPNEFLDKFGNIGDITIDMPNKLKLKSDTKRGATYKIQAEVVGSFVTDLTNEAGRTNSGTMTRYASFAALQDPEGKDDGSSSKNKITFSLNLEGDRNSGSTYTPGDGTNNPPNDPDRISGVDRVETAVNVSKETYPNGDNAVILANKNKFSDVLTAVPLSVQIGAPILFTNTDTLPQETKDEIARLNPSTIYINGGTASVAKAIETNLSNSGKSVTRFNGVDRYHTAKLIAEKIREKGDKRVVEIASGETFPDALSISSLAVKENAPILLSKKNDLTKYTKSALATWDVDKATIAGQTETISNTVQGLVTSGFSMGDTKNPDNVFNGAKDTRRIGGADRYETSTKIAEYTLPDATFGVYASGQVFADSLIAGPYAAVNKAPVLLVKRDAMPNSVQDYTKKSKINKAKLIGGENTVNNNVLNLLKSLVANKK